MIEITDTTVLEITITEPVFSVNIALDMLTKLKDAAARNNKDIELNMALVKSIDSSAIATMVKFVQHLSGTKRSITLTNVSPDIMRVFDMLKLSNFFKIWGHHKKLP